jgi:hypothetical protein
MSNCNVIRQINRLYFAVSFLIPVLNVLFLANLMLSSLIQMRSGLITGRLKCPSPIQAAEFIERRTKLIENLSDAGKSPFVLLKSAVKTFSAPDVPHPFRQCSHFRYLTGCLEPNSSLVLSGSKSTLFVHVNS